MHTMRNSSSSVGMRQPSWAQTWLTDDDNKDEDLALFHDMRAHENKGFIHLSQDEIDASYQSRGFADSPSFTPPWKRNDLLATDAEKNDYDWLLTPPGTPLFPSLDKEPTLDYLEQISRTPTHSAVRTSQLSRTNSREMQNRTSRRSPSPHTPSATSSMSSTSSFMRGKTPSPSRVTSSPTARSATPTKTSKSVTSVNRASMRSSPPILQRLNTSPSVRSSSTERSFPTPKHRTRGTSLSPKPHVWRSPDLGLSEEPPPNLRTCVPDRTFSNSRGSMLSLRSRHSLSDMHGQHSSSSGSRVSSTTASQDYWSSKGSVISSSDDGTDITEPTFIDFNIISPRSTLEGSKPSSERKHDNEVSGRHHPHASQRRRSIGSTETSGFLHAAGRKSIEPSIRRVDHHHISQSMFRPLLSSAPTTFYTEHNREPAMAVSNNTRQEKGVRIFPGNDSDERESVITKIDSNRTDQLSIEHTEMDAHADEFVESNTDGISSTINTENVSETEKNGDKFHDSEDARHAAINQNHHDAPAIKEDKGFPVTDQKYDDLSELGLATDKAPSDDHQNGIIDEIFIDIKEDDSMVDTPSKKHQTSSSHDSDGPALQILDAGYSQEMVLEANHQPTEIPSTCFSQDENAMSTNLNDTQDNQVSKHVTNDQNQNEHLEFIKSSESKDPTYRKELDDFLQTKKINTITAISSKDTDESFMTQGHQNTEIPYEITRHTYTTGMDSCVNDTPSNDVENTDESDSSPSKSPKTTILYRSESSLQHEYDINDHIEDTIRVNYGLNRTNCPLENDIKNNGIQHQPLLKNNIDIALNLSKKSFDGKDPGILTNEKNYDDEKDPTCLQITSCLEETAQEDTGKNMQSNTGSSQQTELVSSVMDISQATMDVESRPDTTETTNVKDIQEDILQRPVNPMEILDMLDDTYPSHNSNKSTEILSIDVHPNPDIAEVTILKDVHPIPGTMNINPEETNIHTGDDKNNPSISTQMATSDRQQQTQTTDLAITANPNWKASAYNFSLEEATNKILFCSSIVHEIVYKAANIAAEKEAKSLEMMDSIFHQERKQFRVSDYRSSLRGKISKPGAWRGRQKENKSPLKPRQKDEVDSVPEPVIEHPVTIDEMKRDDEKMEGARMSSHASKEKGQVRFAANTNCQCNIM